MSIALAAVFSVANAIPAFAGTVGLWHMDESSGNMVDSSGSGNSGTLQNIARA